ncbi:MAG: hypothetical protein IPI67_06260 [Myxococcales bacterium]|nr:hypothetical protein [Myxococcales bacterium]
MTKGRSLFVLLLAYFCLAMLANAIGWSARVDDRLLEYRHWDYGWELLLPWEASRGRWSGRDFAYPIGPLWQLLAWLPNAFGSFSARRAITGLHLVFPLLSLAVALWLSLSTQKTWRARALALLPLALLGLHDDVRSLRGVLPLAALVVFLPTDPVQPTWRRSVVAAALVSASAWLSLDAGALGLAGLIVAGLTRAWLAEARRQELSRLAMLLAAVAGFQAVFAAVLAISGGSYARYVEGAFSITTAYGTTMLLGAEGFSPRKLALLVVLALAPIAVMLRGSRRDSVGVAWLLGTTPFLLRAVLRSDAEHAYAATVPLVSVLCLLALRHRSARPRLAAYTSLLGLTFMLGWFGAHIERSSAWDPRGFSRAATAFARPQSSTPEYRGEFRRLREWLLARKAEGVPCVGLPASKVALHAITGVPGPTAMSLGWSAPLQHEMAAAVRRARCPLYVQEIVSFDEGSWGFGEYMLALDELYEPVEKLGPDLWVTRLRGTPRQRTTQPLPLAERGSDQLSVPGEVSYRFSRPVPWDHALFVSYHFDVSGFARAAGGVPALEAQFYAGNAALGPAMSVPYPTVGTHQTVLPIDAAVAEQRFIAGIVARETRLADRLVLRARGGRTSPSSITFSITALEEIFPAPAPPVTTRTCQERVDLAELASTPRVFFRSATPSVSGDVISLDPNLYPEPDAELYVPVVPCEDACLYAELGVLAATEPSDGVDFEIHVIDGHEKPRLVAWHTLAGLSPKPAELPLARWVGREVMLRFGTRSGQTLGGDRARILRPRIGPCSTRQNLAVAFHQGQHRIERGRAEARGDTLRLEPAPLGAPPTDVRLPLTIEPGSCLALDVRAEDPPAGSGRIAVDVGIVEGDLVLRLERPELGAFDPPRSVKELPLERFWGKKVELRLATWALDDAPSPTAVVAGARLHRCGDGAPWGFGGQ